MGKGPRTTEKRCCLPSITLTLVFQCLFFLKHSKPVLNFRLLLLPVVKLVKCYFKSTSHFLLSLLGNHAPASDLSAEPQLERLPFLFRGTLWLSPRTAFLLLPALCTADPACLPTARFPPLQASPKPSAREPTSKLRSVLSELAQSLRSKSPQILDSYISKEHPQRLPFIFFWTLLNDSQIKEAP